MIAYLKGIVLEVRPGFVILDVQGVGYGVSCSERTTRALECGAPVQFWIETILRQDALQLYGFPSWTEQRFFRLLTTVPGVGARVALTILSRLEPAQLITALTTQDKAAFVAVDGVGSRLASRLIGDLKDKVSKLASEMGDMPNGLTSGAAPTLVQDVIQALGQLGYRREEVERALKALPTQDAQHPPPSLEELMRDTLAILGRS